MFGSLASWRACLAALFSVALSFAQGANAQQSNSLRPGVPMETKLAEGFAFIGGFFALIIVLIILTIVLFRFIHKKVNLKQMHQEEELKKLKPLKK